jgi:hypothetical protein
MNSRTHNITLSESATFPINGNLDSRFCGRVSLLKEMGKLKRFTNLSGQRFGRLLVIKRAESGKNNQTKFECLCDCGKIKIIARSSLRSKLTESCGCIHLEVFKKIVTKHGMGYTQVYHTYQSMKMRCYNEKGISYKNYGGRGIIVCDRWLNSFENFLEDMGDKPTPKHSIDRIDNNGNYEPSNCRWATRKEQMNNQRKNLILTYNGESMNLNQWSAKTKIGRGAISYRLKQNWNIERILTQKPKKNR